MLHSDMTEVPPTTFQRSQAEVNNDITLDMACHNNRIRSVSAPAMHDSKFASTFWKGTQHGKQDFPCYFEIRELNIDKHNHKSLFLVSPEHLWKIQDKIGSFCNLHVYDTTTINALMMWHLLRQSDAAKSYLFVNISFINWFSACYDKTP